MECKKLSTVSFFDLGERQKANKKENIVRKSVITRQLEHHQDLSAFP